MLDLVELPASYAGRYPHELSGGQQQRVALARALAPNPTVVLLDEPFSSLDASLRTSTGQAVVRALHAASATAVLVTHDQDEALSLADQVAVMRAGRLVQADAPYTLYRSPVDADVARFVGGATTLPAHVSDGVASCVLGDLPLARACPDGAAEVLVRPEQVRLDGAASDARVEARVTEVASTATTPPAGSTSSPTAPRWSPGSSVSRRPPSGASSRWASPVAWSPSPAD